MVRIEYGVIDRSIYEYSVLHDPTMPLDASRRPTGWNGRLLYNFGGGCTGGWYRQGAVTAGTTGDWFLRQGYAVASASLNVFGENCNATLGAEVMSMVRERVIEQIGVPAATIGMGCSGGAYQVFMIGDNYPGLLDGILAGCVFPDIASGTLPMITDARLLNTWFTSSDRASNWSNEEKRAASGFGKYGTIANLGGSGGRIDPRLNCPAVLPVKDRYSAENPDGARCDVYSHQINIWGDAGNGVPKRPLDNVGVQYGLAALTAGKINADQFLDLNEGIGGFDADATVVPQRTTANADARRTAYRTGQVTNGGGGLANTPIMEMREYTDELPNGDIHLRFESFALRERLRKANGDSDNHVMWTQALGHGGFGEANQQFRAALLALDDWVTAVKDSGANSRRAVVAQKPEGLADACWSPDNRTKVNEQQVDGVNNTRCNTWYPSYPSPRQVAGAPVTSDVITCRLTDPVRGDYSELTDEQWKRLGEVFERGVCDWDEPGVGQVDLAGTWPDFGR
ncbi:MAG: tannase/feruloyl esterase family alpha/beta hydrolase, partial [Propionibacteriales bacterium]|nr:tannase/feruloyl esterase family alpha/beta hydrolase [Propionibacteriales bacterium]